MGFCTPAGPGDTGHSWKKLLLTVTALPALSFATLDPLIALLVTRAKKASFADDCHHSLNSDEKKEKSNESPLALIGTWI